VCGATVWIEKQGEEQDGLSPRVRGHRGLDLRVAEETGSIPACAGPPRAPGPASNTRSVYPRVCGATVAFSTTYPPSAGLSPRVRGHPGRAAAEAGQRRSIPACAGPPEGSKVLRPRSGVYPRVCGATGSWTKLSGVDRGLSPRVRGHRDISISEPITERSIPACAGPPG